MKRILVPVDFSPVTESAIQTAETMAKALASKISLLHVIVPDVVVMTEYGMYTHPDHERPWCHKQLEILANQLRGRGCEVDTVIEQGRAAATILKEIDERQIDLAVMGSHGHGALYDLIVGSVSEGVLRKATCPVMIVPSRKHAQASPPDRLHPEESRSSISN